MKKAISVIWVVLFILFLLLTINYVKNEEMIKDYNTGIYNESSVSDLGKIEPFVYYYNRGNIFYQNEEYDKAIKEYKQALEKYVPKSKECKVRINLALAMVTPIKPESITADNLGIAIKMLEEARDILVENGCANMDDDFGHSKDAQTLKNEIDAYIELLKNPPQDNNSDSNDQQQNPSNGNDQGDDTKEEEKEELTPEEQEEQKKEKKKKSIQEQLTDLQKEATKEYQKGVDEGDYSTNYKEHTGKSW